MPDSTGMVEIEELELVLFKYEVGDLVVCGSEACFVRDRMSWKGEPLYELVTVHMWDHQIRRNTPEQAIMKVEFDQERGKVVVRK